MARLAKWVYEPDAELDQRQVDVLECAAQGLGVKQTVVELGWTTDVVKTHRAAAMVILDADTITQAVAIALANDFIGLPDRYPYRRDGM